MEVVTAEKKEEAPQKTWNEQLAEEIAKADKIAKHIREKVLLPDFTITKMAELMRISREEAQQKVLFISRFGYTQERNKGGILYHKLLPNPAERIKNIEQAASQKAASFKSQMEVFEAMQEITASYIEPA